MLWCFGKLIQLRKFSARVREIIDETFDERFRLIGEGVYSGDAFNRNIDIGGSYAKFNRTAPWTDIEKMIVYH
jgi:hypothetical protein